MRKKERLPGRKDELQQLLLRNVKAWNAWRESNRYTTRDIAGEDIEERDLSEWSNWRGSKFGGKDLRGADLSHINLSESNFDSSKLQAANLYGAQLREAYMFKADLEKADLTFANLFRANLIQANLNRAKLEKATLGGAYLGDARLEYANLQEVDLQYADLENAKLVGANLRGANLSHTTLLRANLSNADISGCNVYESNAWERVNLTNTVQNDLIISAPDEPIFTVDNLQLAQTMRLLLNGETATRFVETLNEKVVLILGRFTPNRIAILQAIKNELRTSYGGKYVPVVFDFRKPNTRTLTEMVILLAGASRFIIADLSDPKSVLHEIANIAEKLRSVPILPIFTPVAEHDQASVSAMFEDYGTLPNMLDVSTYPNEKELILNLRKTLIPAVEARRKSLLTR